MDQFRESMFLAQIVIVHAFDRRNMLNTDCGKLTTELWVTLRDTGLLCDRHRVVGAHQTHCHSVVIPHLVQPYRLETIGLFVLEPLRTRCFERDTQPFAR